MLISNDSRISQSAIQTWVLLRALPFYINTVVAPDNEYLNLLLMLLKIMEIVWSETVSELMVLQLEEYIRLHHNLFKKLFPDTNMINKHHHIIHYPRCIRETGPLASKNCMRFETKHYSFKLQGRIGRNFKNLAKSLATKHGYAQSVQITFNSYDTSSIEMKSGSYKLFNECHSKQFLDFIEPESLIYSAKRILINSIDYRLGYLLQLDDFF